MTDPFLTQRITKAAWIALKLTLFMLLLGAFFFWLGRDAMQAKKDGTARTASAKQIQLRTFTGNDLRQRVESAGEKPVLVLVYASWCPYCRKYFPMFNDAAKEFGDMEFLAVSIDQDEGDIANYLAEKQPLHLEPLADTQLSDQQEFVDALRGYEFNFRGQLPYLAVFHKGKPIAEVLGGLEKADFDGMLQDIRSETSPGSAKDQQE